MARNTLVFCFVSGLLFLGCERQSSLEPINDSSKDGKAENSPPIIPLKAGLTAQSGAVGNQAFSAKIAATTSYSIGGATASSEISSWPASYVRDGNEYSTWSSALHTTPSNTEWIAYWFQNTSILQPVNFIKVKPRWANGGALCFPNNLQIYYSTGSPPWVSVLTETITYNPTDNDWIIIPLGKTVNANGIELLSNNLRSDGVGNYAFQLAEVGAGYDDAFNHIKKIGNDGTASGRINIRNIGSGNFSPTKLSVWHPDIKGSLFNYNNANIYAPQAIYSENQWNIFYGGWVSIGQANDNIYYTTSTDNFKGPLSYSRTIISNGNYNHANNPTVFKKSNTEWVMLYTTDDRPHSKVGYAKAINSYAWVPSAASASSLINVNNFGPGTGCPSKNTWSNSDPNGGNVLYFDGTNYHLYFYGARTATLDDYWTDIYHATATQSAFPQFTCEEKVMTWPFVSDINEQQTQQRRYPNDLKKFTYGGSNYYVMALLKYGPGKVFLNVSQNLKSFPYANNKLAFDSYKLKWNLPGYIDDWLTSAGMVVQGNRLLGMLYGGTSLTPPVTVSKIYASWLQKQVYFSFSDGSRWGDVMYSNGPDEGYLMTSQDIKSGQLKIYAEDGTSLLLDTPPVTMQKGDIWQYIP